jgi:type II secretory pathway component PulJ
VRVTDVRRRPAEESGFTVIELAIVLLMSSIVMATLVGILDSQSKAERSVNALAASQEEVRLALVEIQRDLRSAEPLIALPSASDFPTQMQIVHLAFDNDSIVRFRWRLDTANDELVRETLNTSGAVTATTYRLEGVTNNTVFRYFSAKGSELSAANATSDEIAGCTLRVRVLIDAAPEAGAAPLDNWSDVQLRNRLPDKLLTGCP